MQQSLKQFSGRSTMALAAAVSAALAASPTLGAVLYWGGGSADLDGVSIDARSVTGANMAGVWNDTTLNWNASSSATTGYQAWEDGNTAHFKVTSETATVTTDVQLTKDFSLSGITAEVQAAGGNDRRSWRLLSDGAEERTITLGENAQIDLRINNVNNKLTFTDTVKLAGTHGFTLNGWNTAGTSANGNAVMEIYSASPISGPVVINNGRLYIQTTGSLENVQKYTVLGANSVLNTYINPSSPMEGINDGAEVVLAGGQFSVQSTNRDFAVSETIGRLTLEGSGWVVTQPTQGQNPTAMSTLHLTNGIHRGDNGKGVLMTYASGGSPVSGLGVAPGVDITGHGLGNNAFIPWGLNLGTGYNVVTGEKVGSSNSVRFLATDADGKLGVVDSIEGDLDLSNWNETYTSGNDDLHFEGGAITFTNALAGDVALRSLAFGINSSSSSVTGFSLNGHELALVALGFANPANSVHATIGTNDANRGTVTTPDGSGELYIIHQRQNTGATSNFNFHPEITGDIDVIFGGATAKMFLTAASTHTGKTYINAREVTLSTGADFVNTSEVNIATSAMLISDGQNRSFGAGEITQTLSGGGRISSGTRHITIGANGILSPGDSGAPDTLSFTMSTGDLILASGATVRLDLGTNSDSIAFTGNAGLTLQGDDWTLDLFSGPGFAADTEYVVFANALLDLTFAPSVVKLNGSVLDAESYTWSHSDNNYTISVVPEPGMASVYLAALGACTLLRRRSRA